MATSSNLNFAGQLSACHPATSRRIGLSPRVKSSLQFLGALLPLGHEPKYVLLRRLGGKGFEPANGLAPRVGKRMNASDAGPEYVAGPRSIPRAVHGRFNLAAQNE